VPAWSGPSLVVIKGDVLLAAVAIFDRLLLTHWPQRDTSRLSPPFFQTQSLLLRFIWDYPLGHVIDSSNQRFHLSS
jgi:hypothetical protein